MYSTCLYCTKDLGANEVLETLPIGRRVAFDAVQGRLWVICRSCEKWNLVPFDTRLETIDACERLFSETRLRFSTDNIGIARLPEGLELVRVGAAQRPEFAAWRYGDQFGRRRKKYALQIVATVVGGGAFLVGGHALVPLLKVIGISGTFGTQIVSQGVGLYSRRKAVVQVATADGTRVSMTSPQIGKASIVARDQSWALSVPAFKGVRRGFAVDWKGHNVELAGAPAITALGKLLPKLNVSGGSRHTVREAVEMLEQQSPLDNPRVGRVKELHPSVRLALEMAAHEDTERTALAGELKLLERQWQEAEEIARIADSLAVPDDVDREVERLSK